MASAPQGLGRSAAAAGALLLAVLLLLTLAEVSAAASAQGAVHDDETLRRARDAVLADSRYQTERPTPQEPPEFEPFRFPPWLAETLYWTILAGVGSLMLYFVGKLAFDLLRNPGAFKRNRDRAAEAPLRREPPPPERPAADRDSLAEADRLAAAGRFGEAIHLLLLLALQRLRGELGPRVAPAMTGRELLHLPALPDTVVEPLTGMVRLSEISHFGGRRAAETDYRRCRAEYLRFNGEAPAAA